VPDDGDVRTVGREEFFGELAAVTRQFASTDYLYLMLREGGAIGVQWEQPGEDYLREYQVVEPDGPVCPHCVLLDAVVVLAPVLPLDLVRTTRARPQYKTVPATGQLPHLAFARRAEPGAGWLGDCHAAAGDPHTNADCAEHGIPTPDGDALDEVDSPPRAVLEAYGDAAVRDVGHRLRIAREWRDAAGEVARGLREAAATWAFLRTSMGLGIPVPDLPGTMFVLPDEELSYETPFAELRTLCRARPARTRRRTRSWAASCPTWSRRIAGCRPTRP
jgi:hypothetical protein